MQAPKIKININIHHRHEPVDSINLLDSQRRRNVFPLMYGLIYKFERSFKQKTEQWIVSRIVMVTSILIYHRHKPIDSIVLLDSQRKHNVCPGRYGKNYRVEF
jgi:hypothetical protein